MVGYLRVKLKIQFKQNMTYFGRPANCNEYKNIYKFYYYFIINVTG